MMEKLNMAIRVGHVALVSVAFGLWMHSAWAGVFVFSLICNLNLNIFFRVK